MMATKEGTAAGERDDSGVEVRVIGHPIGKGLFATKNFKTGDVIFEERPLVSCQFLWNAAYGYLACDFCIKPLEAAEENASRLAQNPQLSLPFPECCDTKKDTFIECPYCDASYCSRECRTSAWNQYHETLCLRSYMPDPSHPLVMLQEAWKQMHYPPETACVMLLARIIATVRQATDKEGAMALFMQFCHRTVNEEEEIAHKLLGEEFQDQLEALRTLMEKSVWAPEVRHWLTPEGFRSLVALVGTNGQGIGTSPLSRWVRNCDNLDLSEEERKKLNKLIDNVYDQLEKEAGGFLNNEGSGLYPLQSSCNHSCNPNAMPTFPYNNFQLVMTAVRDISVGEEICVSYLDECNLGRSRHSRIAILRENYLFTCKCSKCEEQAGEPDVTSEEEMEEGEDDDLED
ncbi:SET and MYND domain-containing protein 5-like [Portunus trituberculatus]|uniref:SET and MYND domain-containing protein 5-like n=1 Tax=Portunus trituberculatus TaxID=210409 RepID=UPI001E1CDD40|nr:SET and MYND domain-containing protein 5-like [Portunus trituberculatus]XP_045109564.1 SET and MYND domain-containing protein 5-like [Portunus trituberculatus]XP_045109565.1 SET and MYND domain-containing protein 5-like [Portunus trituberculatus]